MIISITTKSGRTIHVAPDNEPVFNESEIRHMQGLGKDSAEIIALVKEHFPGGKVIEVQPPTVVITEQEAEQMALLNFNAAEEKEMGDFSPLPAADYVAAIVESEMVENKAGTGHYLKLKFEVVEGECAGRSVYANLNLDNPSQQAVEIARSELKSICAALGKGDAMVNDSSELHDKPLLIKVSVTERKDKPGEHSNNIKKYSAVGGGSAKAAAGVKPAGALPKPWERK